VCLLDHEGHGRSDGLPGYYNKIDDLVEDVINYSNYCIKKYKKENMKVFVQGGSMGGLITLQTIIKKPKLFDGAVLIAPLVDVSEGSKPNIAVIYIAKLIKYFNGTLPLVEIGKLNSEEKYAIEFKNNKLNYSGKLRVGTGVAMQDSFLELQKKLGEIEIPFITLHGTLDQATSYKGSELLYSKSKSKDKTIKIYKNTHHELLWEPNWKDVHSDIIEWLEKRTGKEENEKKNETENVIIEKVDEIIEKDNIKD